MANKDITIPIRIRKELNSEIDYVSQELGVKKSDFIRFILEAAAKIRVPELKSSFNVFFKTHLKNGIKNLGEAK